MPWQVANGLQPLFIVLPLPVYLLSDKNSAGDVTCRLSLVACLPAAVKEAVIVSFSIFRKPTKGKAENFHCNLHVSHIGY